MLIPTTAKKKKNINDKKNYWNIKILKNPISNMCSTNDKNLMGLKKKLFDDNTFNKTYKRYLFF